VTAADIQLNQNIELVNPDQLICTLDKKKKFEMELTVKVGRGFCPGDENKKPDRPSAWWRLTRCFHRSPACVTPWKPRVSATARITTG